MIGHSKINTKVKEKLERNNERKVVKKQDKDLHCEGFNVTKSKNNFKRFDDNTRLESTN